MKRTASGSIRALKIGTVSFTADGDEIVVGDHRVALAPAERAILRALIECRGSVVTRTELMLAAWGSAASLRADELDQQITALRTKLKSGGVTITSVPGIGYSLD
jgi:DNA-binding winged helix-turn-helix (wHTH) protein